MDSGDSRRWLIVTMLVLAVLLAVQIVWFFGTTTLKDYEYYRIEFQKLTDEIARINAAAGGSNTAPEIVKSLLQPLTERLKYVGPQLDSTYYGLKTWVTPFAFWGDRPKDMDDISAHHYDVRVASSTAQVLGLYVLPLLYGLLGAFLAIVQKMRDDDSDAAIRRIRPGPRLVAGAVAGPMIGMFISPEVLNSLAFQVTPFLIAFIGGYATDVFFSLIDRFLANFRDTISKKGDPGPSPGPQDHKPPQDLPPGGQGPQGAGAI